MNAVLERYHQFLRGHLDAIESTDATEFFLAMISRASERVKNPNRLMEIAQRIANEPFMPDQECVILFEEFFASANSWGWGIAIPEKIEALTPLLPYLAGIRSSLDIGCGVASLDIFLAEEGILNGRVTGIDPSPGMLKFGRELATHLKVNIQLDEGYGQALPYKDQSFDLILVMDMIHWSIEWKVILSEAVRVMTEGAIIFLAYSKGAGRIALDPMLICQSLIEKGIDIISVTGCTSDPNRAFILGRKSKPAGLITLAGISSFKG